MAGIGCNKSDTIESETTKTESSETVETVITQDSEVSEETEESDEPDETEMSDESLGSDGKLNEDHSYLYNCKYTKEGLNHLCSLYRAKAEEIYENSENKDLLFGMMEKAEVKDGKLVQMFVDMYYSY